ncbi:enoyl-CoA hydratase/carnithine racemase [Bradyrhizobium sp. CIR48]|uniref:enoyl-CoA hydratase/isomerase family protein n=1 Tax=Bradyrhizobium sp. CIR48 TaxID=2663840 RepID=UPI0016057F47|nr:enoyl-CoA hydratase/isomerase family protein [Bradyrhizobium sp. CIR48]MBB4423833.1 enoyl-CoA hydratase/carnithine racemase [Bradyrhizobium sp. CIR48]
MSDVLITAQDRVGVVEINQPPHNYFDIPLVSRIAEAFDDLAAQGMRAILLCAAGKNFCAGADLSRRPEATIGSSGAPTGDSLYRHAVRLYRSPLPIVAAIQGAAIGGGLGLAMVADFRVASEESRFSANFSRLGFHPGFGLSVVLPRVLGPQQAALLFYTGRRITGAEAHRIGLVDALVPADRMREAGLELAQEIAISAPIAVQSVRATLRQGLAEAVERATDHELAEQERHFRTADYVEGVTAMAERRTPRFEGR